MIFIYKNIKKLKKLVRNDYICFVKKKDLKKSIMTYIYSASKNTALFYCLESLFEKLNGFIGTKIFNLFYKFLNKFFLSSDFFETNINFIKKNFKLK